MEFHQKLINFDWDAVNEKKWKLTPFGLSRNFAISPPLVTKL